MSKRKPLFFIDTNVFIRALINDDKTKFDEVLNFLKKVKNNKLKAYTSSLVLAEIAWTLLSFYKLPKELVIESTESVVNLNGLSIIERQDALIALNLYKKHNVKYIDCLIYSGLASKNEMWNIVSYDKDFDKLGAHRVEPKEFLNETLFN